MAQDQCQQLAPISITSKWAARRRQVEMWWNKLTKGEYANGYFMETTVFIDVDPKMRIAQEEIFGPVGRSFLATIWRRH